MESYYTDRSSFWGGCQSQGTALKNMCWLYECLGSLEQTWDGHGHLEAGHRDPYLRLQNQHGIESWLYY